jgi:hypothetical protein
VIGSIKRRTICGVLSVEMIWRDTRRTRVVPATSDTDAEAIAVSSQRIRYVLGVAPQNGCVAVRQEAVLEAQETGDL